MSASQETKAVLPPNLAETLAMWDQKIAETKKFLCQNPDVRLTEGAREILAEYEAKKAKAIFDWEHPAPAVPPPPTPELIKQIGDVVQALLPQIIAEVVVRLRS